MGDEAGKSLKPRGSSFRRSVPFAALLRLCSCARCATGSAPVSGSCVGRTDDLAPKHATWFARVSKRVPLFASTSHGMCAHALRAGRRHSPAAARGALQDPRLSPSAAAASHICSPPSCPHGAAARALLQSGMCFEIRVCSKTSLLAPICIIPRPARRLHSHSPRPRSTAARFLPPASVRILPATLPRHVRPPFTELLSPRTPPAQGAAWRAWYDEQQLFVCRMPHDPSVRPADGPSMKIDVYGASDLRMNPAPSRGARVPAGRCSGQTGVVGDRSGRSLVHGQRIHNGRDGREIIARERETRATVL